MHKRSSNHMRLHLNLTTQGWYSLGDIYVKGYCYNSKGKLCKEESLVALFADVDNEASLRDVLSHECNGIFAIIINHESFKALAIDDSRVYPLFYTAEGCVSDHAYNLIKKGMHLSQSAISLYSAGGMTWEGETLIKEIMQVKPAGYVLFDSIGITSLLHYDYRIPQKTSQTKSLQQLSDAALKAFEETISSVEGRQIIVPLSGGYDSRLVACMLKKTNYPNVLCYTVGDNNSYEVQIARKVTERLGLQHIIIDITDVFSDSDITQSTDFKLYYEHMGNLCNFSYVFEYAALHKLKQLNVIENNAVFMPGHSGDFYGGAYIRKSHVTPQDSAGDIANKIIYDILEFDYNRDVYKHIKRSIDTTCTNYSIVQHFVRNHSLAHNINNSARVYEYFGHEVRLPFWNRHISNFFKDIDPQQLHTNRLYYEYVHSLYQEYDIDFRQPEVTLDNIRRQWWRNRIKKRLLPKKLSAKFVKQNNITNEMALCKPMLKELKDMTLLSVNEIMKEWYLVKVKERLNSTSSSSD